jgi:putative glutathione S-transferase
MRALKGLEDAISISIVHSTWQRTKPDDANDEHAGWVFRSESDPPLTTSLGFGLFGNEGCIPDTVNHAKTLREVYELANDTFGKYSVPVLWDKKLKIIVNNESSEIVEMFNSEFNDFAKNKDLDLSPPELKAK